MEFWVLASQISAQADISLQGFFFFFFSNRARIKLPKSKCLKIEYCFHYYDSLKHGSFHICISSGIFRKNSDASQSKPAAQGSDCSIPGNGSPTCRTTVSYEALISCRDSLAWWNWRVFKGCWLSHCFEMTLAISTTENSYFPNDHHSQTLICSICRAL